MLINRELYMNKIRPFIGNRKLKILTGIRRSGKSSILELIKKELKEKNTDTNQFLSLDFEDMRYAELCNGENLYKKLLTWNKETSDLVYFFLDEIQNVQNWESCIASILSERKCDIYITASSMSVFSPELDMLLKKDYHTFMIYPFSFQEFSQLYLASFPETSSKEIFTKYLFFGGIPYLEKYRFENELCTRSLQDLSIIIQLKDILSNSKVRDVRFLETIIRYLFANAGISFTATSLSKYFKENKRIVSAETILQYLTYCEKSFLFYRIHRRDIGSMKQLTTGDKFYPADHGMREACLQANNIKSIHTALENIVFIELLRREYHVTSGTSPTKTIDFIAEKGKEKIYIQVNYLLTSSEALNREIRSFSGLKDHYPKYIVTLDEANLSTNGIRHKNIREFLLMKEWM